MHGCFRHFVKVDLISSPFILNVSMSSSFVNLFLTQLAFISSLSPYSFDLYGAGDSPQMTHESIPIGAIPLISTSQIEYLDAVVKTVSAANQVYAEFLKSDEGQGFNGQIVFIGDAMGSILGYDALTKHSFAGGQYTNEDEVPPSPSMTGITHDSQSEGKSLFPCLPTFQMSSES
jgi:hypothetical protein